jgi:eukaryotic-like serine/threonine-protein kinase
MKVTKEQWQRIEPLLSDALAREPSVRQQWLADLIGTDAQIGDDLPLLKKMIASHEAAETGGDATLLSLPNVGTTDRSTFNADETIGGFCTIRLLGRGGMGEVWLAAQIDGRVEREVALKLPTRVQHLDVWRRRFERERNILSKLSHPNIARLFDAGIDTALSRIGVGQPYLALEYVDGKNIVQYADENRLSIRNRLSLFRQVLNAVAYAHRQLVVHRDLKPGNILVTASGEVKLLDFGIAKLLDHDDPEHQTTQPIDRTADTQLTELGGRLMTPRYAAPEQIEGESISTGSDIYSLGMILFELLTGQSPYAAVRGGEKVTPRMLLASRIDVPSSLSHSTEVLSARSFAKASQMRHALSGDIDAILLKALRSNPIERYDTASAFDTDLAHFLDGRPVLARAGTWRYLAGRMIMRHRVPFAAGAALLLATIGGLIAIDIERREVDRQRERAERHFAAARSISNSLIFDVHDEIQNLSGSTKAREKIVLKAQQYLSDLSNDAALGSDLRIEVAQAYRRLADIQGRLDSPNLGKPADALATYEKAIVLMRPISAPGSSAFGMLTDAERRKVFNEMTFCHRSAARIQSSLGKYAQALETMTAGANFAALAAQLPTAEPRDKILAPVMQYEVERSRAAIQNDRAIRVAGVERAREQAEKILVAYPNDSEVNDSTAWLNSENGHALRGDINPDVKRRALTHYLRALAIRESMLTQDPKNAQTERAVVAYYTALSHTHRALGEEAQAIEFARNAVERMRSLTILDSANLQYQRDLAATLQSFSLSLLTNGERRASVQAADEALKIIDGLPKEFSALRATVELRYELWKQRADGQYDLFMDKKTPLAERATLREAASANYQALLGSLPKEKASVDHRAMAEHAERRIRELSRTTAN